MGLDCFQFKIKYSYFMYYRKIKSLVQINELCSSHRIDIIILLWSIVTILLSNAFLNIHARGSGVVRQKS